MFAVEISPAGLTTLRTVTVYWYYYSHFPIFLVKMHFTTFVILSVIIPPSVLAIPIPLKEDSATVLTVRSAGEYSLNDSHCQPMACNLTWLFFIIVENLSLLANVASGAPRQPSNGNCSQHINSITATDLLLAVLL